MDLQMTCKCTKTMDLVSLRVAIIVQKGDFGKVLKL